MRIRHSLKAFVPFVVMLLRGLSAEAQSGSPYPSPGPVYYNGSPGYGQPTQPAWGQMPGQGFPPSFRPHSVISHYDHMLEQHFSSDGLWFRNATDGFGAFNSPQAWYFGVDYTRTTTRKLQGIVGDEDVQTYAQQGDPDNDDIVPDLTFYHYFDAANAGLIPSLKNNGIKLNGGFWNPDGTGLMLNASWQAEGTSWFNARRNQEVPRMPLMDILRMRRTNVREDDAPYNRSGVQSDRQLVEEFILAPGVPFDTLDNVQYGFYGTTFDVLDRSLFNLYSIPLGSGPNPLVNPPVPEGASVPYDMDFIIGQSLTTLGGSAAGAFSPIYERNGVTVRPFAGGRYFRIDEAFMFRGVSSLLSYGLNNADNDTPGNYKVFPVMNGIDEDSDLVVDNIDEPGNSVNTTTTTFAPIDGTFTSLIVRSYLTSQVVSNLGGPEIGLQYELGERRGMKVSGSTRLGLMFNHETLRLQGDNIGNFMGVETVPDPVTGSTIQTDMFNTDTTNGPTQNAFQDSMSTTHLSPLFEQGLNAELPIFSQLPVIGEMWQFEDAKLNLGWSFLMIGEVTDPNQSVNWNSRPILGVFPTVTPRRETFWQNSFNVGVNWNY